MIEHKQLAVVTLWRCERTLGTRKFTLLLTRGDGAVDVALKGSVGHVADLVVGLDVLLDGLTAVEVTVSKSSWVRCDGSDVRTFGTSKTSCGETNLDPLRSLSCSMHDARQ